MNPSTSQVEGHGTEERFVQHMDSVLSKSLLHNVALLGKRHFRYSLIMATILFTFIWEIGFRKVNKGFLVPGHCTF